MRGHRAERSLAAAPIVDYSPNHRVLQQVQRGRYQPDRDATPWVRFCVAAHIRQARERLDQTAAASARWAALEGLVASHGWPDRLVIALEQSLFDGAELAAYAAEADVSLRQLAG